MSQGVVTQYLVSLIAKQVEESSLVVWYDPDGNYRDLAECIEVPGASIARYDGSFLKLVRDIDSLLNGPEAPKLVVYVPLGQASTHSALIELEGGGRRDAARPATTSPQHPAVGGRS
jgi:hypothetical protein